MVAIVVLAMTTWQRLASVLHHGQLVSLYYVCVVVLRTVYRNHIKPTDQSQILTSSNYWSSDCSMNCLEFTFCKSVHMDS